MFCGNDSSRPPQDYSLRGRDMGGRQPMTGMDDVERQTPHGDTEILDEKTKDARDCRILCIAVIGAAVITAGILVPVDYFRVNTHYYVAIDSVSGLDPAAEGLSFNLTLGVGSWSYGSKACIKPGTFVEVSYRGVQLAASEAEVGRPQICAGPRKSAGRRVAAMVTGVPVGHVLDRLTSDMEQGAAVFDVTLHLPAGSYGVGGGEIWLSECKGSRVGAAAMWCDAPSQEPTL